MTTEQKFKLALREMMQTKELDDINVTTLCAKLHCHRQTFYYHFRDIYDLLAAIFLNEEVPGLRNCYEINDILECLLQYAVTNFDFLKSTYKSAGADLVTNFFYNKIINKMIASYSSHNNGIGLTKMSYRNVARRFSAGVSQEFGFAFKAQEITAQKLEKFLKRYIASAVSVLYPALIVLSKEERKK